MKEYALYKGDDLLAMGTAEELAEMFGVKKETIYYYSTPASSKKAKKGDHKRKVAVRVN